MFTTYKRNHTLHLLMGDAQREGADLHPHHSPVGARLRRPNDYPIHSRNNRPYLLFALSCTLGGVLNFDSRADAKITINRDFLIN